MVTVSIALFVMQAARPASSACLHIRRGTNGRAARKALNTFKTKV